MVHIRPPCSQQWHLSICHTVAPSLVFWCIRNLCHVSVARRWHFVFCWYLLLVMGSKEMEIVRPQNCQLDLWLWHCVWEVTDNPFLPDLVPRGYHFCGPHKKLLAGRWFATDADVRQAPPCIICICLCYGAASEHEVLLQTYKNNLGTQNASNCL